MKAKQQLGQNFLMHQKTADRIASSADLPKGAHVLEIGPGTGMLTRALLGEGACVTAIEADGELVAELTEAFAKELTSGALTLIHGDIRSFDLSTLSVKPQNDRSTRRGKARNEDVQGYGVVKSQAPQRNNSAHFEASYYVVANIPYYITGEIIRLLLTAKNKPASITLLVQKEVAVRVARSKKESLLSLSVKVFGTPKYLFTVPRGAFRPAPSVDSAVLHIHSICSPFKTTREEAHFFSVLHAGFAHKRKKLSRNLEIVASPLAIHKAFTYCELAENLRAEDLSLSVWLVLADKLKKRTA